MPRQRIVPAAQFPPVATTAARSIFAAGQAAKPRSTRGRRNPPDPAAIVIKTGVPIPPHARNERGVSAYAELWARMRDGDMVELQRSQANAFQKWAQKSGLSKVFVRRVLSDEVHGCWRVAAKDAGSL